MFAQGLAILYAGLALAPAIMHLALAAGAPLGPMTLGGRFPGRLPPAWRGLALVQAGMLAAMAGVMLDRAGLVGPGLPAWMGWAVLAVTGASHVANATSRSAPERRLWGPVTLLMVLACLGIVLS